MRGGRIAALAATVAAVALLLAAPYGGTGEAARRPEPWWKEYLNSSVLLVEIEGVATADTSFERLLRENGREVFDVSVRRAYRYGCFDSERQALELRRMYVRKDLNQSVGPGTLLLLIEPESHEWSGFYGEARTRMYGVETGRGVFEVEAGRLKAWSETDADPVKQRTLPAWNRAVAEWSGDAALAVGDGFEADRLDVYFDALWAAYQAELRAGR